MGLVEGKTFLTHLIFIPKQSDGFAIPKSGGFLFAKSGFCGFCGFSVWFACSELEYL